jgi:hypothetical protein
MMQRRLKPITSQHALTTQTIHVAADGQSAKATTYFTGLHFGTGKWLGQQVTAWGRYEDELVRLPEGEGEGRWLVRRRECKFMGRLGEERVMNGEEG